ncbi:MAG: thiamine-phosphate kinase [Thiobacillaceae bacterium]
MPGEFDLIEKFFTRPTPSAVLGVGDDCALVKPSPGMELAVTTDMLLAGRHFLPTDGPGTIGHKSLAVNLSDLAAMGATPRWVLLAIGLPEADEKFLRGFTGGFFGLAQKFGVELIGGDTTRSGLLTLSITAIGEVPPGQALRRDGAKDGDDIWVSGTLGDAAAALAHHQGALRLTTAEAITCFPRLFVPTPRVELGLALRGIAHSCIDVSDGFAADLGHILQRSGKAAEVEFESLPLSPALKAHEQEAAARNCILAGGDDYELVFTASPDRRTEIEALSARLPLPLARVGSILPSPDGVAPGGAGEHLSIRSNGKPIRLNRTGFDHFAAPFVQD